MTSGGPGDHPLTDIVYWRRPVYGHEADALIRKIAGLCSSRELQLWWEKEVGWHAPPDVAAVKARGLYAVLADRARDSGWEIADSEAS